MNTFQIYDDLMLDIDILKQQIELARAEQEQWWFDGRLFPTVPLDVAAARVDKLSDAIERMELELEVKMERLNKLNEQLQKYKGLEYKVFYMRYVECMTLRDIADKLNYNYDYIRRVAVRLRAE